MSYIRWVILARYIPVTLEAHQHGIHRRVPRMTGATVSTPSPFRSSVPHTCRSLAGLLLLFAPSNLVPGLRPFTVLPFCAVSHVSSRILFRALKKPGLSAVARAGCHTHADCAGLPVRRCTGHHAEEPPTGRRCQIINIARAQAIYHRPASVSRTECLACDSDQVPCCVSITRLIASHSPTLGT